MTSCAAVSCRKAPSAAFVLTVPDEIQCKPASLIAARCIGCCPFVTYIVVCVCVCVRACVRACVWPWVVLRLALQDLKIALAHTPKCTATVLFCTVQCTTRECVCVGGVLLADRDDFSLT